MQHQGNGGSLYGPPAGMQPPVMQRTSSPNSEATAPSASNSNHPHQGYPQYNYAGPLNPGQLNFPEHSHQYAHQHPHQHPHPQSAPQPIPQSHQHPVHPMPMHHSPVPAPHPHLQGSPSFHHEPDRKGSLASNVKSTGQAMFNKFWSLGRSLSMSEASLTVTHGDAPPSYSSSVRTESSTTKSGPLFPSHLQDVPLKSGPLFGLHSTISSGTGTISSSGSLSSNTSSRGIIRSGSKAADVLNYDPANPPLVFSIRRNGLRNTTICFGDSQDVAFAVIYPLTSFGDWDIRLQRSINGPILYKLGKALFGWDMTLDSPSDPLKSMKLVKTGVPYETKLVGEAIKKRCHKFEFQGVTYQWDGAGLGNNLTCKISGTNNLVALIRRHPTTFLSGGVIEIQPGGQHMLDQLVATALAVEEWENDNAVQRY